MLKNSKHLRGFAIQASDGELGTAGQFYFDDVTLAVRYLVVETGAFHDGRRVLILPTSILHLDEQARQLDVALTLKELMDSPHIDTQKAISRQHETAHLQHFGYATYWEGPDLWGSSNIPASLAVSIPAVQEAMVERLRRESSDSHLRRMDSANGLQHSGDGLYVWAFRRFYLDDKSWAVRYIEVATRDWSAGKMILVSPAWIKDLSWDELTVYIDLSGGAIASAPEYVEKMRISRGYEQRLYSHYGQPPYWLHEAEEAHSLVGA